MQTMRIVRCRDTVSTAVRQHPRHAPARKRLAHEEETARDGVGASHRQQQEESARQPSQELARNVGRRQIACPNVLAPMGEFVRHGNGCKMHERDLELVERIGDLQPRPERKRRHPADHDGCGVARAELDEIAHG
jgi:hypothetical protein